MTTVNIEGVGKVNFPDNYTPEKIQFAIENDILPRMKSAQAAPATPQDFSRPDKPPALARVGRGFMDVAQGVKQGAMMLKDAVTGSDDATAYTKEKTDEEALYERGRGPDAGIDLLRLGGNVLGTAPAMAIPGGAATSLPLRILSGAAQGGTAAASMFTPEGSSKGEQIALGATVGGAVPVAGAGVRKAAGGAVDRVRALMSPAPSARIEGELTLKLQQQGVDFNKLTQEVKSSLLADAQKTLSAGGTLDDVALANKATIEAIPGAKATRASVTRDPRDWQTEKNLRGVAGVGDDIVIREQGNAKAMTEYLTALRTQTGGKAGTALDAGESSIAAIRENDKAKEKVVTELYDAFRSTGAANKAVPDTRIADALGRVSDEIGTENIPSAVLGRLKEFGFAGGARTKLLTVNEADKLNRLINNNNPGHGPASLALGKLKQALNQSLLEVPGEGAESLTKARAAAAQRFSEQDAAKGVTAAIDDVAPDRFVQKFIIGADVRDLRGTLTELRKTPAGQQAVKDIKGHVMDNLLLKSTGATNLDDVTGKPFSGVRFSKALDGLTPEKMHQLFSPEEVAALRQLQKASKLMTEEVPFSDVNHSKTAAAMANLLQKIGNTPLLGQVAGMIAGPVKLGLDWSKNAADRQKVAEVLVGSAGQPSKRALLAPNMIEKTAPAIAGGAAGAMSYQE